jgi:hypothetical protein
MCKQFFYHSTLCAMCIKCMNVTRTKFMAYCNVKVFKKSNLWEFAAIDKTWPTFNKIWNKIISFDMKKKVKCKIGHGKNEGKGEFGSPWNESLRFKCHTLIKLKPRCINFL